MASIENRSTFVVKVRNRDDLTRTFAVNRQKELKAYLAELRAQGLKPQPKQGTDYYAIRIRALGRPEQCLFATSEQEAIAIKQRVESERTQGYLVDYTKGRKFSLADLLVRYLQEISPRHKGFEIEGYCINALLADAGLGRLALGEVFAAHKNPHPSLIGKSFSRAKGKSVRQPTEEARFIRKPFADLVPEDFNDYIDERSQCVAQATVDRELDLLSTVCTTAIDTWRIPIAKHPMDGVLRPKYFNERDRRLKGDEEPRMLQAAFEEDARTSIEQRLEELMQSQRLEAQDAETTYRRKSIIKTARAAHQSAAEASYVHVPMFETFICFQLMSGARRNETMLLLWKDVNLGDQTAFIPDSKNGRARTLALRSDLVNLLQQLPRTDERVFPFTVDHLRKVWARICTAAGLVGVDELHVHDLRHEAISRVAEAGANLPGGFSLVDLQAFSGHRDTRMLLRYTHLSMPSLAKRLDEAFSDTSQSTIHRGRRRLKKGAVFNTTALANFEADTRFAAQPAATPAAGNVLPFRRREAA